MLQISEIIEHLSYLFSQEQFALAEQFLSAIKNTKNIYNDTLAIFEATLAQRKENSDAMWEAIQKGLAINDRNFELYILLGEYYLPTNPNQAYLCFENALFYCTEEADKEFVRSYISELKANYPVTVRNTSLIILSYNLLHYTKDCIESIRKTTPESAREIVIVDNASSDGSVEWLQEQPDIVLRANKENSGFPKGCNEGVEVASSENDIFLLNNDTILPPNALFWLRMGLYEDDSHGTTGSVSNSVVNLQEITLPYHTTEAFLDFAKSVNIPMRHPYEEKIYLVGFALLIRRSVWDSIGGLDERFSPGNFEDNDYGVRVLLAGYKNILCKNSFIIHFGHKSFEKRPIQFSQLLETNSMKFFEKWNIHCERYFYPQPKLVNMFKEDSSTPISILEIGCRCGATAAYIRGKFPFAQTYGIENHPFALRIADKMTNAISYESTNLPWPEHSFDYIIVDTMAVDLPSSEELEQLFSKYLKQGGCKIIMTPNNDGKL